MQIKNQEREIIDCDCVIERDAQIHAELLHFHYNQRPFNTKDKYYQLPYYTAKKTSS